MAPAQPTLVRVRDLQVRHAEVLAVAGVDLTIEVGERVALVGGSGSGKTTIAQALLGLLPRTAMTATELQVGTVDVLSAQPAGLRHLRGGIAGYAMQDAYATLDPLQRVGSAIAEAHRLHHRATDSQMRQLQDRLLMAVGLDDGQRVLRAWPHELSGGQRQRVGLALALAARPQLLIADEPSSALDGDKARALAQLLVDLATGSSGWPPMALLLISHDLRLVSACCQRVLVLHAGHIVEAGPVAQILTQPHHQATQALMAHAGLQVDTADVGAR